MTLTDAITRLNYILRGTDDDAPASGTDEYTYWLDTLNRKKNELYNDTTNTWRTAYSIESLGSVTASATPTYDLPTNFLSPASNPYIITTDSNRVDQVLSTPQAQSPNIRTFYIAGINPQTLYCSNEIKATENIVGGTLYLPGYYLPDDLVNSTDELAVPDADWLVMATASEIAFNDIVYEDKSADINAKANALYQAMVANNRRAVFNQPNTITYNGYRISQNHKR